MSVQSWLVIPGLISAMLMTGCGGGGGGPVEKLVPVGGKLLVDGQPLDGVEIQFNPDISKQSRGGIATTDASGAFTVTDIEQNLPGLPAGNYTLTYSRMRMPDGSAPPKPGEGPPADPGIVPLETFPMHLKTIDTNNPPQPVVIPPEGNTNLELSISTK